MNEYVVSLESVRQADAARVGAKAAALGTLLAAGYPVPPGLCVTAAAFRLALGARMAQVDAIVQGSELGDLAGAAPAQEAIERLLDDLEVPAPVVRALGKALPALAEPGTPLAVRSSATAEDSARASYAGQYRSTIGVRGQEAAQAAIVDVWRSFYSANALVARATYGGLVDEAMAVLILPLVEAECAGVALSVDPVGRRRDRVVVTSAWGLGAGVVDGTAATDTAWVRRDGYAEGFEIERQRVVEQRQQLVLGVGEKDPLRWVPVPGAHRRAASLPGPWAQRVAQFCVAAEVLFGAPQDIEWAIAGGRVWVLQSRPITALPPELARVPRFPVAWSDERDRRWVWIHYPYFRYVLKPLEIDYVGDREVGSLESSRYSGGERYQRNKIANGRFYTAWVPNDLDDGDRRVRRAAMADLKARLRSQDVTPWEHWGPEIVKATERLGAFDPQSADGPGLAAHLEDARSVLRRHWAMHGSRLYISRQPLYTAYAAVAGLAEPAAESAVDVLLEGVETISTRLIDGLHGLACTARERPALAALVADPPPDVRDRLAAMPEAASFCAQLEGFLDTFGERSGLGYGSDATICQPTWLEDIAAVLGYVAPYLDPCVEAPHAARARAKSVREAQVERVCSACEDPEAVAELRRQLAYGRRAAVVMEEHNHYIDQLMNGQLRLAIVAAARWLVAHGTLATEDEVFWLHYDEILSALRAEVPPSFSGDISARQTQHAEWERLEPPPLLGTPEAALPDRPPPRDEVTPAASASDGQIRGLGASPGRSRGQARVVPTSVLQPDLSPGDVLVAENVGPRWTPLLPILGGMVLDGGGVGQHHAITAREYGVPAVIGTGNATRRIPDGAWVTVDGTTGTVEIEE
jgi:pyruvate,water dikinase